MQAVRQLVVLRHPIGNLDRKSTRLNSSHQIISYAVFCLKKKKKSEISNVSVDYLGNYLLQIQLAEFAHLSRLINEPKYESSADHHHGRDREAGDRCRTQR